MSASSEGREYALPMRIQARAGSEAEELYAKGATLPGNKLPMPKAIANGIGPEPLADLIFHGGKVVPKMEFQNIFLGRNADWREQDAVSINIAIDMAMNDKRLNNVMAQYFPGRSLECHMRESFIANEDKSAILDEPDIQNLVMRFYDSGRIEKSGLNSCLFNFVLPPGTILKLDHSTSLGGLGGYHGSIHITHNGKPVTLYYSANVYSEVLADGRENGIVVFDRPWKNVVATLYHEINEYRTDADVKDAIINNDNDFLGWMSRSGKEVGDQPIIKAGEEGNLGLVFQEVENAQKTRTIPIQFMYSNTVHGAEGPINTRDL